MGAVCSAASKLRRRCRQAKTEIIVAHIQIHHASYCYPCVVGKVAPASSAADTTGLINTNGGVVLACRSVHVCSGNPVLPFPGRPVGGGALIAGMGVVFAPFHDVAEHVLQAKRVRPLPPNRKRSSSFVVILHIKQERPERGTPPRSPLLHYPYTKRSRRVPGCLLFPKSSLSRCQRRVRTRPCCVLPLGFARQTNG